MNDDARPNGPPLPPPDSIVRLPQLHPATVKLNQGLIRVAKNMIGVWETWLKERQQ